MRRVVSAVEPSQVPAPQWQQMETLTHQALALLGGGEGQDAQILGQQLEAASLKEIDFTGVGFFVQIDVPRNLPKLSRNGVVGDVEPAKGDEALGLMLFVTDGYASQLEVVAYDAWPEQLNGFRCRYVRWLEHGNGVRTAEPTERRDPNSMWV